MAFDEKALDSLRIERAPEPGSGSSGKALKWIALAALVLVAIAGGYALLRNDAIEVQTATAAPSGGNGGSAAVLNASGYVVERRQATVSSKVTGKVAEVMIEEGTEVKQGDLLARLDDTTSRPVYALAQRQLEAVRKSLEEVQVRLAEAERNLRRSEQLRRDKLVSEAQLDQAQSEVAAIEARLEALRSEVKVAEGTVRVRAQELEDLLVRAPFDGVVVSKDAQPGEMVSPISAGGGFTRTRLRQHREPPGGFAPVRQRRPRALRRGQQRQPVRHLRAVVVIGARRALRQRARQLNGDDQRLRSQPLCGGTRGLRRCRSRRPGLRPDGAGDGVGGPAR